MLGLAYLVELTPTAFYLFFAFMLLSSTTIVMALMLVPKLLRHRENASQRTTVDTSSSGDTSSSDIKGIMPEGKPPKAQGGEMDSKRHSFVARQLAKVAPSVKVHVTPVHQFSDKFGASSHRSGASASSKRHHSSTADK